MISPDTLHLVRDLLGQVQLSVGHPDFTAQATRFAHAVAEVDEAISSATK